MLSTQKENVVHTKWFKLDDKEVQTASMEEAVTYQDVLLVPQYSDIISRTEVDIGNNLDEDLKLNLPIISSPMDTISESKMATAMSSHGGMSIIHRYNSIEEQAEIVRNSIKHGASAVGAAVGVTGNFMERAEAVIDAGAKVICIDVAHGHHILTKNGLIILRDRFPDMHIMAGNVATREGFEALIDWGADSIRCNIGGGSICTTRVQTGHGVPGLQTILECARASNPTGVKIIADGGIRNAGDIVKALAAGADFVMVGSLLSGTDQAPGKLLKTPDGNFKQYRGMASRDAQMNWRGKSSSPEGVSSMVPWKGDANKILDELSGSIKSGLSYTGARTIEELQKKAKFIKQTNASQSESSAHILKRYR
jgi:IMP dehydrogenase